MRQKPTPREFIFPLPDGWLRMAIIGGLVGCTLASLCNRRLGTVAKAQLLPATAIKVIAPPAAISRTRDFESVDPAHGVAAIPPSNADTKVADIAPTEIDNKLEDFENTPLFIAATDPIRPLVLSHSSASYPTAGSHPSDLSSTSSRSTSPIVTSTYQASLTHSPAQESFASTDSISVPISTGSSHTSGSLFSLNTSSIPNVPIVLPTGSSLFDGSTTGSTPSVGSGFVAAPEPSPALLCLTMLIPALLARRRRG